MGRSSIVVALVAGATCMTSAVAYAEEPIVGNWKTEVGDTASIDPCGSSYCVKMQNGKYAGRQIGKLSGDGGSYSGTLTDPASNKTYNGSGSVSGSRLTLKGCVMKVFCQSQVWARQ